MWVLRLGMDMVGGRRRWMRRWADTCARREPFFALDEKLVSAFEVEVLGAKMVV